ncbi:MAG: histidine--tRNA ligase, partial [Candidatus Altiarchaeota archaeon]|nr:histidine--tRNA ligase [Candidatus Altiarchaeota archaeon]
EMRKRQHAEAVLRQVAARFNYGEVLFPAFEHTSLFQKKSGEEIAGHMYVFEDKGGRSMCLRPEATASVARMYGTALRGRQKPVKVFYFAPMYRYEEPQKNRYREFWQFGFELIGARSAESDAETITLAVECLRKLGIEHTLEISHLGILRGLLAELGLADAAQDHAIACLDRKNYDELKKTIDSDALLKLIELKGENALEDAEKILAGHQKPLESLKELKETAALLDAAKISYSINLGMARGLAYYTGMILEIRVPSLGAQSQICGGGRYDNLIKLFTGLDEPAVGFAFGFDRVLDALESQGAKMPSEEGMVIVAAAGEDARTKAFGIANMLRQDTALRIELDLMNRKLSRILEYAAAAGAKYVVIAGSKELSKGMVVLKDIQQKEQKEVRLEELSSIINSKTA